MKESQTNNDPNSSKIDNPKKSSVLDPFEELLREPLLLPPPAAAVTTTESSSTATAVAAAAAAILPWSSCFQSQQEEEEVPLNTGTSTTAVGTMLSAPALVPLPPRHPPTMTTTTTATNSKDQLQHIDRNNNPNNNHNWTSMPPSPALSAASSTRRQQQRRSPRLSSLTSSPALSATRAGNGRGRRSYTESTRHYRDGSKTNIIIDCARIEECLQQQCQNDGGMFMLDGENSSISVVSEEGHRHLHDVDDNNNSHSRLDNNGVPWNLSTRQPFPPSGQQGPDAAASAANHQPYNNNLSQSPPNSFCLQQQQPQQQLPWYADSVQLSAMISNFSTSYNVVNISLVLPILQQMIHMQQQQQYEQQAAAEFTLQNVTDTDAFTTSTFTAPSAATTTASEDAKAAVASSLLAGMIVGQVLGGALGDSCLGRLGALLLVMLLQTVAALGSACFVSSPGSSTSSTNTNTTTTADHVFWTLATWRFLLGIGAGGVYPLAAVLSAEQKQATVTSTMDQQQQQQQLTSTLQEDQNDPSRLEQENRAVAAEPEFISPTSIVDPDDALVTSSQQQQQQHLPASERDISTGPALVDEPIGLTPSMVDENSNHANNNDDDHNVNHDNHNDDSHTSSSLRRVVLTFSMQGLGFWAVPATAVPLLYCYHNNLNLVWRLLLGLGSIPGLVLLALQAYVHGWKHGKHAHYEGPIPMDEPAPIEAVPVTTTATNAIPSDEEQPPVLQDSNLQIPHSTMDATTPGGSISIPEEPPVRTAPAMVRNERFVDSDDDDDESPIDFRFPRRWNDSDGEIGTILDSTMDVYNVRTLFFGAPAATTTPGNQDGLFRTHHNVPAAQGPTNNGINDALPGHMASQHGSKGWLASIRNEANLVHKLLGTAVTWFLFDVLFYGNTLFQPIVIEAAFGSNRQGQEQESSVDILRKTALDSLILTSIALPGYAVAGMVLGGDSSSSSNNKNKGSSLSGPCTTCWRAFCGQTPRYVMLQGFAVMSILYMSIGLYWNDLRHYPVLLVILYGLTFFFANYGPNTTTFVLPSLVYSPECRSTLNGLCAAAGKLGALTGATLFEPASDMLGDAAVMILCSLIAVLAFGLTKVFVIMEEPGDDTPQEQERLGPHPDGHLPLPSHEMAVDDNDDNNNDGVGRALNVDDIPCQQQDETVPGLT